MKLYFSLVLIGAISFVISLSVSTESEVADLLLVNIEALAGGESLDAINCVGTGSVHCPITNSNVYVVISGYSGEIRD